MHTLLLIMVTSGLVLLQTNQGLTANQDPDSDFLEEATADGFIVGTTNGPPKTEKPQNNYNSIVTHDSLNPEANLSVILKESLPTVSGAKFPEASTELTTENTHKLPRKERAAVSITVDSSKTTRLTPEENAEGSGIFSELDSTIEAVGELDISSDGSGMFPGVLNKNQSKGRLFPTTVHISGDLDTSTHVHNSLEENNTSGMGSKASNTEWMTTTSTKTVQAIFPILTAEETIANKSELTKNLSEYNPEPTKSALVKEGTPGWLLILAVCLTVGAVVCVLIGIATKDMWYGPSKRCLNINSTKSKSHEEYNRAATLPLSEKEKMALMCAPKEARKETDCTISIEEAPEKEYLM